MTRYFNRHEGCSCEHLYLNKVVAQGRGQCHGRCRQRVPVRPAPTSTPADPDPKESPGHRIQLRRTNAAGTSCDALLQEASRVLARFTHCAIGDGGGEVAPKPDLGTPCHRRDVGWPDPHATPLGMEAGRGPCVRTYSPKWRQEKKEERRRAGRSRGRISQCQPRESEWERRRH